jgi:5'-3' exonuclease
MIALLDGDIFTYRVACTTENEDEGIAVWRINEMVEQCLQDVQATECFIYLTGVDNFRKQIYPEYKANRTQPKPRHLQFLRDYLTKEWQAEVVNGMEADDYLGINQTDKTVICSIDKDLLQVPGQHYNFVRKEHTEIDEFTGLVNFYTQMLVGDRSDNIKGIDKIGPVKAAKALAPCETEQEMFDVVRGMYLNDDWMIMNGRCLYIKRTLTDDWKDTFDGLTSKELDGGKV